MARRLLLVGAGKMGGALLKGWLARGIDSSSIGVIETEPAARERTKGLGVAVWPKPSALEGEGAPAAVIFAVKPQGMADLLPAYRHIATQGAVVLSIAAGRTIAFIERHLGPDCAVVRGMPNTPAEVGCGITVACANRRTTAAQKALCDDLLRGVGVVEWVEDEALLEAVTAVSGSGPAYVFHFLECLRDAGVREGLPLALALRLARETVIGSSELLRASQESLETLRRNVTSPGGTTEAALAILMAEDGLRALIARAVAAARRRARELAG